jgi:O-antigen/teichoic acid export membrane protein
MGSRFKNAVHALASGYAAMGCNLLYTLGSVPLALHYLSREQFGLWSLVTQVASYLLLIDAGVTGSVGRLLIDHKDSRDDGVYGTVIKTACVVLLVQGVCIALGGVVAGFVLAPLLEMPDQFVRIFRLLVAGHCAFLGALFAGRISMALLQAHQRFDVLNYTQMVQLLAGFATQWVTFHFGWGLYSMLASSLVMLSCGVANNLASAMRLGLFAPAGSRGRASWKVFRQIFAFANDLFLAMMGLQLLNASQVLIVTRTEGLSAAAVWTVATKSFQLAFQFVQRIFDFSGSALGEMIVRGERANLRRRFRDVLMVTASCAVFVSASVAVCNAGFVALWTKGRFSWPWQNDALMGVLLLLNLVSRCYIGLAGYAKRLETMRWIYFLEGASFVVGACWIAPRLGMTGIILVAIAANVAWSGSYGIRWAARYLEVSKAEIAIGWLRCAARYLAVMVPLAAFLWWATWSLTPPVRFALQTATMAVAGVVLLWKAGLTTDLRLELKEAPRRLLPG